MPGETIRVPTGRATYPGGQAEGRTGRATHPGEEAVVRTGRSASAWLPGRFARHVRLSASPPVCVARLVRTLATRPGIRVVGANVNAACRTHRPVGRPSPRPPGRIENPPVRLVHVFTCTRFQQVVVRKHSPETVNADKRHVLICKPLAQSTMADTHTMHIRYGKKIHYG